MEMLATLSIIAFGVMGLRLPTGTLFSKVLYTGVSVALIFLPIVTGGPDMPEPARFPLIPLFLIVLLRSCLLFKLSGRLLVAGLAFGSFLFLLFFPASNTHPVRGHHPHIHIEDQARVIILSMTLAGLVALLFGLVLVFVLLSINALLAERQSREQLLLVNEQLRQYAQRIEDQATLQERNRIAREIHDSLDHSLTAQSIQLENALMFWRSNTEKAQEFLLEAKRLGSNALQEVRQSIAALRSNPLQGQSLESAILSLIEKFHQKAGTMPDCTISLALPLSSEVSTTIYQIVQEALNNIYKHSGATQVTLHLQATAQTLSLLVEDNGKGFNLDQNTSGLGIQKMRIRAVAIGGRCNITSKLGVGCRIVVYVPLSRLSP